MSSPAACSTSARVRSCRSSQPVPICRASISDDPRRTGACASRPAARVDRPLPLTPGSTSVRMTRLGYQIPNFTYPGVGPAELFDAVARQAREADTSGFDTVLVMDHFYQLPMLGEPDALHARVLQPAVRARSRDVDGPAECAGHRQHVPGPAVLAKTVTTLDIVSNGRAQLGIGAGWFELEHDVVRHRVRHVHRPLREAGGVAADRDPDAARRASDARRQALHGARGDERATAVSTHPRDDRRRRREEDAADGRPVRRRVEPHLLARRTCRASSTRSPSTASSSAATAPRSPCRGSALRASPRRTEEARGRHRRAAASPRARHRRDVGRGAGAVAGQLRVGRPGHGRRAVRRVPRRSASTDSPSTCRPPATSRVGSNCSVRRSPLAPDPSR